MRGTVSRIQCCSRGSPFPLEKRFDPIRFSMPGEIHPRMAWIVSTKVDTHQQHTESVRGGAVWAGRTVGAMDCAIEPQGEGALLAKHCFASAERQPPAAGPDRGAGFTACPADPHRPAIPRNAASAVAVAVAVAGQRPWRVPGAARPSILFAVIRGHIFPAHLAGMPGQALGQEHRAVLAAGAAERHRHIAARAITSFGSQVSRKSISWPR